MKKYNVTLLGCKPLAERVLEHLSSVEGVNMVGIVPVPREQAGWGRDLSIAAERLGVKVMGEDELLETPLDVAFSVNYHKIIREPLLSHPKKGIVNIHHSYRLRLRGRYSGAWAILNARKDNYWRHGTTLHYIDKELDKGRIIATESFGFGESETGEDIYWKADDLAMKLFKKNLPAILEGKAETTAPDPDSRYYDAHSLDNKKIDLSKKPEEVWDFVRALTFPPHEQPYIDLNGRRFSLKIRDVLE